MTRVGTSGQTLDGRLLVWGVTWHVQRGSGSTIWDIAHVSGFRVAGFVATHDDLRRSDALGLPN
jgi:hypothetical protein